MSGRPLGAVFIGLALAACGGEGEVPQAAGDDVPVAAEPPARPAETEAEPLGPEAVARAIAEDSALEAENRATYQRRLRSMGGYDECMAQARGLPPATRARIEAACQSRRETP